MVKNLFLKYTVPYLGLLILALALFFSMDLPVSLPVSLFFLVYIGVVEFSILFISLNKHVHWFLQRKFDIVLEFKQFMLAYAFFLLVSIVTNFFIMDKFFILLTALVIPALALAVSIIYKFIDHHILNPPKKRKKQRK